MGCVALLTLLAACGGQGPRFDARQEASQYRAHASRHYTPPGPPEDPWRPYIEEASRRFDVPERWIREVMRVESGGHEYVGGEPVTSPVGAMGLMQVMPQTYDMLKAEYGLGDDPYDPHNSILAGAAYIRQMYDIYGSPGFLAAYNAGPKRLDEYLSGKRALPAETRHYVAMIGPYIQGIYPSHRSSGDMLAMNRLPIDIPPGRRHRSTTRHVEYAMAERAPARRPSGHYDGAMARRVAARTESRAPAVVHTAVAMAEPPPPPPRGHGFHLVSSAYAADVPMHHAGGATGAWAVQVGAFSSRSLAHAAAASARERARLASARDYVGSVREGHVTLYRARLIGLSRDAAVHACATLQHGHHGGCMVLSPEAQS